MIDENSLTDEELHNLEHSETDPIDEPEIDLSDYDEKIQALCKFLEENNPDEIDELNYGMYDHNFYKYGRAEYLVLTDSEADELAEKCIKESVWSFNADFLISYTNLPLNAIDMIKTYQDKCEDSNDGIIALISDWDSFVSDAISCDSRGHFMSTYDGEENEEKINGTYYFIYRIN